MSAATTAAQVGAEYAEEIFRDGPRVHGDAYNQQVDVEEVVHSTCSIPDGDATWMERHGIQPNSREYWCGYNARMAELDA